MKCPDETRSPVSSLDVESESRWKQLGGEVPSLQLAQAHTETQPQVSMTPAAQPSLEGLKLRLVG